MTAAYRNTKKQNIQQDKYNYEFKRIVKDPAKNA